MAFDPKVFLAESRTPAGPREPSGTAPAPGAFDPKAFLGDSSGSEARILELGGVKQPDGTYLVPGEGGSAAFRLDADGNRLDEAPAIGEESTAEAIGNRVVATAGSALLPLAPQAKGLERGLQSLTTDKNFGDEYRKGRDDTKRDIDAAKEKAGLGYEILGAVASGGVAAPETLLGRVAFSGVVAAGGQALASDVDLTKDGADLGAYAADIVTSGAIGLGAGGLGEGIGAGLRRVGGGLVSLATKAFQRQEAADVKAIEKGIKSLAGELGSETQKGSRFIENVQRGTGNIQDPAALQLAQGVLQRNEAAIPGQLAVIAGKESALAAKTATRAADAAAATASYFDKGLWAGEILPKLKGQAPRWGMAAGAMVLGQGYDLAMGEGHTGKASGAGFGLAATLGSPGMRAMLGNVVKSNRVQKAIGDKLAPIFFGAANAITRGGVIAGPELAKLVVTEAALGQPSLAAEQLAARGGMKSLLGDNGADLAAGLNAPQSELDRAIAQTVGVTLLGGALEDSNATVEQALARMLSGKPGKAHKADLPDFAALSVNPQAMLERLANNTGSLSSVAPGIAAELAATAQRATDYMLKVSATPPRRGPLAPEWVASAAEKRSIRLAAEVVDNPLSILDAAAAGMLVPEQVAALNAVYPMLGRSIQDKALAAMAETPGMSYRARLMVGFLTGVDVDGTLASISMNQQAIRAQSQKPSTQGMPDTNKLTVAQRTGPVEQQQDA